MAQAHILVVDDEPDIRYLVKEILEDEGYRVSCAENGETARSAYLRDAPDLVLLDIWMPDVDGITLLKEWSSNGKTHCPVLVMSGHGTVETAVEATRLGAYDFIQKPISLAKLLAVVRKGLDSGELLAPVPPRAAEPAPADEPLGNSPEMQLLRQRAQQAARHDSSVAISGETGSGREALAAYIHRLSDQSGPLMVLDHCQAKGAKASSYLLGMHHGDHAVPGLLERARGGSLLIADLPALEIDVQHMLNNVLETGQFTPEGSVTAQDLDLRIIVTTGPDLEQQVRQGHLLETLWFRVNVLPLSMPALRDRAEDIPDLIRFYAEWFPNHEELPYREFSMAALNSLRNHSWPGNVRELRNMVQRLLILGGSGEISGQEVDHALRDGILQKAAIPAEQLVDFDQPLREAREAFERKYLKYQLRKTGGSVGKLAEAVGMERTHLYRKLRALGINPKTVGRSGSTS